MWIALRFRSAARMTGKLWPKLCLMKLYSKQCGYYVNFLYLVTNKITWIYPSKYGIMHSSDFTRLWVFSQNRGCWSARRSKWITCWQGNPFSYMKKIHIRFVLWWTFLCMQQKSFLQQNEGNSRQPSSVTTSPRSIFSTIHALQYIATRDKVYWATTMTSHK